jgi:hypothetical protein
MGATTSTMQQDTSCCNRVDRYCAPNHRSLSISSNVILYLDNWANTTQIQTQNSNSISQKQNYKYYEIKPAQKLQKHPIKPTGNSFWETHTTLYAMLGQVINNQSMTRSNTFTCLKDGLGYKTVLFHSRVFKGKVILLLLQIQFLGTVL